MSVIEDLIAKHCPNGVAFEPLKRVARIRNGKDYKSFGAGDVPVYGSGGVMTYVDTFAYDKPSVLIPRKGSLGNLFYVDVPFWTVDTIFYTEVNANLVLPKFLYYFLGTLRLSGLNQAGGVPSQTHAALNEVRIALPPLAIQAEVVAILDKMMLLRAELDEELKWRALQHSHYRHVLLTFKRPGVRWVPMSEVCSIGTGSRNTNEAVEGGKYPFFVRSQEPLAMDSYEFDERAVITAGDGVGVGKVFHYVEGKYALHQRAYRVSVLSDELLAKFLFHYIRNDFARYLATTSVHASVTSLRKPMFERYPVPLPPLAEQRRIVAILDKFDALVNDLSVGLPAEINARRKQYEYYRDRLLTFQEAPA